VVAVKTDILILGLYAFYCHFEYSFRMYDCLPLKIVKDIFLGPSMPKMEFFGRQV
jgi:hypothetical protein